MPRPFKNTADYFPHKCGDGPNKFVIQQQFGNDGYAVWIKTLELLTVSENHVFDFNNPSKWLFLCAKMGVTDDILRDIYGLLSTLTILDSELYNKGALYCPELIDSLSNLYDRRKTQKPNKYDIYKVYGIKNPVNVNTNKQNDNIKPQSIVEYSKVKDSREEKGDKSPPLNERKKLFWLKVNEIGKALELETLKDFYSYWIEKNEQGRKMRFELEKVFDIKRRLKTWDSNNAKWNKTNNIPSEPDMNWKWTDPKDWQAACKLWRENGWVKRDIPGQGTNWVKK